MQNFVSAYVSKISDIIETTDKKKEKKKEEATENK